jgi:hypothetical protein
MRLSAIRAEMKRANITAYLVPSTDAHQSEYLAPEDRRRQYISGEYRPPEAWRRQYISGEYRPPEDRRRQYISGEYRPPENRRR